MTPTMNASDDLKEKSGIEVSVSEAEDKNYLDEVVEVMK